MDINSLIAALGPKVDITKIVILVVMLVVILVLLKVVFGKKKKSRQSLYTSDVTNDAYKTKASTRKGEAETYTVQTQDFDDSKVLRPKDLNEIFHKKKKQNSTLNAKELDQLQKELLADFEMAHNVNELIEEAISFDSFGQRNKALESLKQAFELEQDEKEKTRLHMLYKSYRDQKDSLDNLVKKYPAFKKKTENFDIFNVEEDVAPIKNKKQGITQIEHNQNDLSLTKKEKKKESKSFSLNESVHETTVKESPRLLPIKDEKSSYNFDIEEDIPVFTKEISKPISNMSLEDDFNLSSNNKDFEDTVVEEMNFESSNNHLEALVEQELSEEEKQYLQSFTQSVQGNKQTTEMQVEKSDEDFFNNFMQRVSDNPTLNTQEITDIHQEILQPSIQNIAPVSFIEQKSEKTLQSFDNQLKKSFDKQDVLEEYEMKIKKTNSDIWVNWMSLHGGKVQMKNNIISLDHPWATKSAVKQLETKLQEIVGKDQNGQHIGFSVVSIHEINDEN